MDFREWAKDNCFQSVDAYVGAEQAWDYQQQKIDELQGRIDKVRKYMNEDDSGKDDGYQIIDDFLKSYEEWSEDDDL